MKKISVLFTGVGDPGVVAIIKSFKGKYHTVALDMNKFTAGLYIADSGYVVPACTDKKYSKLLFQILKKEKIDIIVPTIDEELVQMSDYAQRKNSPTVLLPKKEFVRLCLDKWRLSQELAKRRIPYARTLLLSHGRKIPKEFFPCIIKPRVGRGSRGFAYIKTQEELNNYLTKTIYKKNELILQEFLDGAEYTVSVVVDHHGHVLNVVPKEVIEKVGITKVGITRQNKQIANLCKRIAKDFNPLGPFNVQLIITKKTESAIIFEINPRLSTTVALTIASGINEVDTLIRSMLGLPIKRSDFEKNLIMIRYEDQIYLPESKIKS